MTIRIKFEPKGDDVGGGAVSLALFWLACYKAIEEFVSGRMSLSTTSSFTAGLMFAMTVVFGATAIICTYNFAHGLGITVAREPGQDPPSEKKSAASIPMPAPFQQ